MKAKDIILFGYVPELIELVEYCGYNLIGILDNDPKKSTYPKMLGNIDNAPMIHRKYPDVPINVAIIETKGARERIFRKLENIGFLFENIISPKAHISPSAKLGRGIIVFHYCHISTNAVIGDAVKMYPYTNIMHDGEIGDFCTFASGSCINGFVKIGRSSYLGSNSVVKQLMTIGSNSIIGAGATVVKDVPDSVVVVGTPAKFLKVN